MTQPRLLCCSLGGAAKALLLLIALVPAQAAAQVAKIDVAFFESKIRPVLVEKCYECHSATSKPLRAGLRLDHRQGLRMGGDLGPAIDSDVPENSLLLRALKYDELEMPPGGKLPAAVIADFEAWIRAGCPDPREDAQPSTKIAVDPEAAARWWAFQPVQDFVPPDSLHASSVIDAFVNLAIAKAGLQAAEPAPPAMLLRRVTFDLTGLPPTAEEIESFQQDTSPDAYERVVDRLLASPAFGERWGRHWLDAARYADSNGADENHAFPAAWKYRDYVVRAFNSDTPYARFVHEQLAGDLLPESSPSRRIENWTATGFLIIGPKMLAEQDKPKMVADIVDEQIDTFGQAFMGLTFGCARCHDHKFDPIATRDYYALAGIFHSTKTMANLDFVSQWNTRDLPDEAKQKEIDAHKQMIADAKAALEEQIAATGKKESELDDERRKPIREARKRIEEMEKSTPKMTHVMAADEAEVKCVPIHIRGNHLQPGDQLIPRAVPVVFTGHVPSPQFPEDRSGRLELAHWLTDPNHPLTSRVMINRLWQGHFGDGLVRSPGNFGLKGDQPTHPELLDWLALDFIASDWSMKRMHRKIVLSDAYRRTSIVSEERFQSDLENRLWTRQNRRRLEIEPLRDAILSVGGNLDRSIGGQAEAVYGKMETTGAARSVEEAPRRTLYLSVNRAALSEVFSTFDYVDSAVSVAKRNSTVVPHQSLFLMNNPLVIEQALLFSQRVRAQSGYDRDRIDYAVQTAFGRRADAMEIEAALAFLAHNQGDEQSANGDARTRAWHRLCLALLTTSEFITIE